MDLKKELISGKGLILNVDKPIGFTSFDIVRKVKKWSSIKKVGHAGTLDPLATGVLILLLGKATKRAGEFLNCDKIYYGVVELGVQTNTDDSEGEIIEKKRVPLKNEDEISAVLKSFEGEIDQIPPMFSALKKDGQRLYKLARQGKIVERKKRSVKIYKLSLIKWESPFISIKVHCSKGTYIRSLAKDIGEKLGTVSYLKELRRLKVGEYTISKSYSLSQLQEMFSKKNESLSSAGLYK